MWGFSGLRVSGLCRANVQSLTPGTSQTTRLILETARSDQLSTSNPLKTQRVGRDLVKILTCTVPQGWMGRRRKRGMSQKWEEYGVRQTWCFSTGLKVGLSKRWGLGSELCGKTVAGHPLREKPLTTITPLLVTVYSGRHSGTEQGCQNKPNKYSRSGHHKVTLKSVPLL